MKRLILLLILFVNLQIVITHEDMRIFSYLTASAQHMTKEGNDNCYLEAFDTDKQARDRHEEECGRVRKKQ